MKVSDVFKEESDAPFLEKAGLTDFKDPRYTKYSGRLKRLRGIRKYAYRMDILERSLSYEEVTEIFVRVNSLGAKLTTPLCNMLERTRATAVVLRHLNKKENLRGMYRGGGSIAIVAAARAAFAIAAHPDEPGVKVFAAVKHNLGPKPHSLTYSIEAVGSTSRIVWGGQTDLSASDVLSPKGDGASGKAEQAKAIIAGVLAAGPRGSNEVEQACEAAGISRTSYWRARKAMGVKAEKTDFDGQWLLTLPSCNGHSNYEF